jgi:hypothetical protein
LQIGEIAKRYFDVVRNYVRLSHFNIHGIRKGSGTHAASATTCPPLFTSIACRGEWSMGKILDVYFQFAAGGDYYLGQLLSLKDPNSVEFALPCPHWKDPNAPVVLEAIQSTFGKVLLFHGETEHDPKGVLSLLLASMCHHSSWMLGVCQKHPGHPFSKIPLLSSPLLQELVSEHLTLELNEHVPVVTGIPPHVEHMCKLEELKEYCIEIKTAVNTFNKTIRDSVAEAIDEKVKESGGINAAILDARIRELEGTLLARLDQMSVVGTRDSNEPHVAVEKVDASQVPIVPKANEFNYKGRYWCVPENFQFPKDTKRLNGWRMWLCGQVFVSKNVAFKLKPFRLLQGKDLHNKTVERELATKWKPIFRLMEQCPAFEIPEQVEESFVLSSFLQANEFLKSRACYIFDKTDERVLSTWSIGTWSRKVQRSEIERRGTAADKAMLPGATARNQPHKTKRSFVVHGDARADGRIRRLNKTPRRIDVERRRDEAVTDSFAAEFG